MWIRQRGFSLLEILVALSLSGVLLLGTLRLFPALQRNMLHIYQSSSARDSVWQLAFRIGKDLQRAGYCHGICTRQPLQIEQQGSRVVIQWQAVNKPGSSGSEYERTGYRLHQGELQMLKTVREHDGELWERISDPGLVTLTHFSITRQLRSHEPPLLIVYLVARQKLHSRLIEIRHIVRGENL